MVIHGDCIEVLKTLPDNSVDSCVTDPPYELGFMGKSWDNTGIANNKEMWGEVMRVLKPGGHLLAFSGTRTYHRMAVAIEDAGFEVRDMIEWVYASGFPKSLNVHKQLKKSCTCGNMEVYERTKQNTEHSVRPVQETNLSQEVHFDTEQGKALFTGVSEQDLSLQQSEPTENVREGQPSVERRSDAKKNSRKLSRNDLSEMPEGVSADGEERRLHNATQASDGSTFEPIIDENGSSASHRPQSEKQQDREPCAFCKQWGTQATRTLGIGTALKPAHEPICMARKPLGEKTVAENVLKYGTGGINIDESRVGTSDKLQVLHGSFTFGGGLGADTKGKKIEFVDSGLGRFPANLIHDNSEEVRGCFPDAKGMSTQNSSTDLNVYTGNSLYHSSTKFPPVRQGFNDSGNASRFFKSIIYQAKASKSERNRGCEGLEEKRIEGQPSFLDEGGYAKETGKPNKPIYNRNNHPTVKPIALMEYLIKMVTPKGGTVLDPFMGSGSTGVAAKQNGYDFIGIDMTPEYVEIAKARMEAVIQQPQLYGQPE